jgi:hypothetical protein
MAGSVCSPPVEQQVPNGVRSEPGGAQGGWSRARVRPGRGSEPCIMTNTTRHG